MNEVRRVLEHVQLVVDLNENCMNCIQPLVLEWTVFEPGQTSADRICGDHACSEEGSNEAGDEDLPDMKICVGRRHMVYLVERQDMRNVNGQNDAEGTHWLPVSEEELRNEFRDAGAKVLRRAVVG